MGSTWSKSLPPPSLKKTLPTHNRPGSIIGRTNHFIFTDLSENRLFKAGIQNQQHVEWRVAPLHNLILFQLTFGLIVGSLGKKSFLFNSVSLFSLCLPLSKELDCVPICTRKLYFGPELPVSSCLPRQKAIGGHKPEVILRNWDPPARPHFCWSHTFPWTGASFKCQWGQFIL